MGNIAFGVVTPYQTALGCKGPYVNLLPLLNLMCGFIP